MEMTAGCLSQKKHAVQTPLSPNSPLPSYVVGDIFFIICVEEKKSIIGKSVLILEIGVTNPPFWGRVIGGGGFCWQPPTGGKRNKVRGIF